MIEVAFKLNFHNLKNNKYQENCFKSGIHIVYGESGIGKSNLCRVISGYKITNSKLNFEISGISGFKTVMLVNQNPDTQIVAPTVERELAFNFENLGLESNIILKKIDSLNKIFNFSFSMNQHPETLSGGEREVLNFSTAISVNPECLLLDDSFAFLNSNSKEKCFEILSSWQNETNSVIIWVTSNQEDLKLSNSRWILNKNDLLKVPDNFRPNKLPKFKIPKGNLILTVDELNFSFIENFNIFSNVSCKIGPFRCLGIIGNNGSGKSTFVSLIAKTLIPISGKINIDLNGKETSVGIVPQSPERIFGAHTPEEIAKMLILENVADKTLIRKIKISLERFSIVWDSISNKLFGNLSLSESRIVLLVLVSHCNYNLIIFDEPMFSLGTNLRRIMVEFLVEILQNKYLILISHNYDELNSICDKTVIINRKTFLQTDKNFD